MSTIQRSRLAEGVAVAVVSADSRGHYRLHLRFDDGLERDIDFEPFLRASSNPQIRAFLDPERFMRFELRDGELVWGDYELCFPIADLYEGKI
jgi:hypothetical protein